MRWLIAAVMAVATAGAAIAAESTKKSFDLQQGDAGRTLTQFAQQADCEILFRADAMKGVATQAVRGLFTPRDALDRLIAGTDLVVTQNEKSGMIAVTRRKQSVRIVRLPPYIVNAAPEADLGWRYAAIPGFEILSCCPSLETQEFIENIYRLQACLDEIVPPNLQARSVVPTTLILLNDDVQQAMSRNMAILAAANAQSLSRKNVEAGAISPLSLPSLIPQIRLWDRDAVAVDIVLEYRGPAGYNDIGFTPNYFFSLLGARVPPLPPWFIAGILNLYQDLYWPAAGAGGPPAIAAERIEDGLNVSQTFFQMGPIENDFIENKRPPLWIPPERPGNFAEIPRLRNAMPFLPQLFTRRLSPKSADNDKGAESTWRAEACLFVRWAFDDESLRNRQALWQLVQRSGAHPVDETMFRECFGFGFDEMRRKLIDYLPVALKDGFVWNQTSSGEIPRLELRDSTLAEKARILGDWERMEIEFVRTSHPEYAQSYIEQADRTLKRAYDAGERDPGFLAVLGLYECTIGDDGRARGILEAAVRAGVARPSAYVELARIRLTAALAAPNGAGDKLDRLQAESVLGLLRAIRSQPPPQARAYLLAAETLEHSLAPPTAADLAMLEEGVRYFPENSFFVAAVGRIKAMGRP